MRVGKIIDTFHEKYSLNLQPGKYLFQISKRGYQGSEIEAICRPGNQTLVLPPCKKLDNQSSSATSRPKSRVLSNVITGQPSAGGQTQQQAASNPQQTSQGRPGSAKKESRPISAGKSLNIYVYDASQSNKPLEGVMIRVSS